MAAEHETDPVPVLTINPEQALVGVRATENGREVTRFFAEEETEQVTSDEALRKAIAAIGSWSDLDWEETVAALDRIRHESTPTPPIEDL